MALELLVFHDKIDYDELSRGIAHMVELKTAERRNDLQTRAVVAIGMRILSEKSNTVGAAYLYRYGIPSRSLNAS